MRAGASTSSAPPCERRRSRHASAMASTARIAASAYHAHTGTENPSSRTFPFATFTGAPGSTLVAGAGGFAGSGFGGSTCASAGAGFGGSSFGASTLGGSGFGVAISTFGGSGFGGATAAFGGSGFGGVTSALGGSTLGGSTFSGVGVR